MGKLFFTGRLDDVALGQAVDFFGRLMGNLFDVRMAPFTFDLGMYALIEYVLVYKQESKFTFFIYPAETGVFVAHETVADIGSVSRA